MNKFLYRWALHKVCNTLQEDPELARGLQCNIAMPIADATDLTRRVQQIADTLIQYQFGGKK